MTRKNFIILIVVVGLIVLGLGAWYFSFQARHQTEKDIYLGGIGSIDSATGEERIIINGTVARFSFGDIGVINASDGVARIALLKDNEKAINQTIKVGEKVVVGGLILEVLEVKNNSNTSGMPGSSNGYVRLRITAQK